MIGFLPFLQSQNPAAPASPSAPDGSLSIVWIVLAVAALFVAILGPIVRRRRISSTGRPGTFGDPTANSREELERVLAEIQDLSREHIARLDTKIRLLNQLLAECDQKKRELEALLGRSGTSAPAKPGSPAPVRSANPLHDQVYALQDSGKNVFDICTATGLEKGEVDLILGLRKMRSGAP